MVAHNHYHTDNAKELNIALTDGLYRSGHTLLRVGDEDDDFVGGEGVEHGLEVLAGGVVEPGGGFVEEEYGGVGGDGADDGQALPLAHGELAATVEEAAQLGVEPLG